MSLSGWPLSAKWSDQKLHPGICSISDFEQNRACKSAHSTGTSHLEDHTIEGVSLEPPYVQDILDYLAAFYHGLPVELFPCSELSFTPWNESRPQAKKKKSNCNQSPLIGLASSKECIRIRTRTTTKGVFATQLNLDDLLDAAMTMLPNDAYALLLLVNHDLYEDEEDEFVCVRAYRGSRVAVVSRARYHPGLDDRQDVERDHAWPGSYCDIHMQASYQANLSSEVPPKSGVPPNRIEKDTEISLSLMSLGKDTSLEDVFISPLPESLSSLSNIYHR